MRPLALRLRACLALVLAGCGGGSPFVAPLDRGPRMDAALLSERLDESHETVLVDADGPRCAIRLEDGRLVEAVGITGDGDAIFATRRGRISIDRWLTMRSTLVDLLALVDAADGMPDAAAATTADQLDATLAYHPLTGAALRAGPGYAMTPGGPFAVAIRSFDRDAPRDAVRQAIASLDESPARVEADVFDALRELVDRAGWSAPDADGWNDDAPVDDLSPESVRRMIRHGWLRRALDASPTAIAVENAVALAAEPQVIETWSANSRTIERVSDAFGNESWIERGVDAVHLAVRAPEARLGELDWGFPDDGWVVLDLATGTDPLGHLRLADVHRARFDESGSTIATWTRSDGLSADHATWRDEVPIADLVEDHAAVDDYLPPHLVVRDVHRDLLAILTAHGIVEPPRGTAPEQVEAFLANAAIALPDPAHLDLLGEYFVDYAFDGLDIERPDLPGTADAQGDRHQTVAETLATGLGGVCFGDCDDLAELYVELLHRQGRHALPIGVPGHMFAASADRGADGWAVHVLQTGPAETHRAAELVDAVTAAIRAQDPDFEPDPLALEAWPRIDARPLRTLTWIDANALRDEASAAHVIDHARAEQRGLWGTTAADRAADLEHHLASRSASHAVGEDLESAALHTRLAEALRRIGDHRGAAEHASIAAGLTWRPGARIPRLTSAIRDALAAGDRDRVESATQDLVATIDAWQDGRPLLAPAHAIVAVIEALLVAADGGARGARIAAGLVPRTMLSLGLEAARAPPVASTGETDLDAAGLIDMLDLLAEVAARASRRAADPADREVLLQSVRSWTATARARDEFGRWPYHAAIAATMQREAEADFVRRLTRTRVSTEPPVGSGDPWPWYAGACETWAWEIDDRIAPGPSVPDARELGSLLRGIDRAAVAHRRAAIFDTVDQELQLLAAIKVCMVIDDDGRLGAAVRVAEEVAADVLPGLADEIARLVPRVTPERYLRAVRIWLDTEGRAYDAFRIAWATRAAGDSALALEVARRVVASFDDPEFAREFDVMVALPR